MKKSIVGVLGVWCAVICMAAPAYGQPAEVYYQKALDTFRKCQNEKNPRVVLAHLEKVKVYAEKALGGKLSDKQKEEMTRLFDLSRKVNYSDINVWIANAIKNRIVVEWMTKTEVRAAWGKPARTGKDRMLNKEEWRYENGSVVSFEGDYAVKVSVPQDSKTARQ